PTKTAAPIARLNTDISSGASRTDSSLAPPAETPGDSNPSPSFRLNETSSSSAPPNAGPVAAAPAGASTVSLEDVVSSAPPAVVSLETSEGRGSGFFAGPNTIITNRHVVAGNVSVSVKLSSGATVPGRVDQTVQEFDLALVHVDSASATVLPLGSVNDVRP